MKKFWVSAILAAVLAGMFGVAPVMAAGGAGGSSNITNICDDAQANPGKYDESLLEIAGCKLDSDANAVPVVISLIQVVLTIVGVLTVAMIIYGGVTYIISTGDAVKIQRAKNTILYGVVGLVISLMAFAIVRFISVSIWG